MTMLNLLSKLTITKDTKADCSVEKGYLGQWHSTNHQIRLYAQDNKIWAVVKDMFGKVMLLPNEHIKGGINGIIAQDNLLKMIKCSRDRIEITLHQNRNNHFTLWIIPKLEAAGRADEALSKQAEEYAKQARSSVNSFSKFHNPDNFDTAFKKYQEAFNQYKKALNVRKKNAEDTQKIEADSKALRKELFLFKLQKIDSYLPNRNDRKEVENNFKTSMGQDYVFDKPFEDKYDVFEGALAISESTPEGQRSMVENFVCAHSAECLKNYTLAIKSYLLLSKQHCLNRNKSSSSFCIKKAGNLIEEAQQVSDFFNIADFLKEEGTWLSDTIRGIPGCDNFEVLLEENRLKGIAYKFIKNAREEAKKYSLYKQNEETFNDVCRAYKDAIHHLRVAYHYIEDKNRNVQEVEAYVNKLKKELFEFKLPHVMDLYLPSSEDQKEFSDNKSLSKDEKDFSSFMRKLIESLKEKQTQAAMFTRACVNETVGDTILAMQNYLYLSQQYIDKENSSIAINCLKKAETLSKEATKTSDELFDLNFFEMLDRNRIEQLLKILPDNDSNIEYLKQTLLKKDAIRIAFEAHLHGLIELSNETKKTTCFICFNVEEKDVGKWLENTFVPDLCRVKIEPIFCFNDLGPGRELNAFQGLIRETDLVVVVCTPALKKKCDVRSKQPVGSAQEIRLAIERYNEASKYETLYLIYLGDRKSSCPSVFFEPILGTRFSILDKSTEPSVFNYYSNAFELFGNMCDDIHRKGSRVIKNDFLSEVKKIISGAQLDIDNINLWRENHMSENANFLKSIKKKCCTQDRKQ